MVNRIRAFTVVFRTTRRELITRTSVIIIIGLFSLSLSFTQIYKATFVDGALYTQALV